MPRIASRLLAVTVLAAAMAAPTLAAAQITRPNDPQDPREQRRQQGAEEDKAKVQKAPPRLRGRTNAGPCPYVKVLYDAARYVEFDGQQTAADVAWTGEIQGVEADCSYRGNDPIRVEVDVLFDFGKGPKAQANARSYRYWVAVTERNRTVLAKEYFDIGAEFGAGEDRVRYRERLGGITIPRGSENTSGANFEVLVGFDVTPEMAAFNREGKRFRVNAGQQAAAEPAPAR